MTRKHRASLLGELEFWLSANGHPPLVAFTETPIALDAALVDYGQHMWSTDRTIGDFRETLNAIGKEWSHVKGRIKTSWDVVTAWQKEEPGGNRAPVPPLLARALVALCLIWGGAWLEIGALIALGFEAALRPGDLLYLLRSDLRFAHESGTLGSCLFVILRHSKTAKTRGARFQHVCVENTFVIALLWRLYGSRPRTAPLFSCIGSVPQRSLALTNSFTCLLRTLRVPTGQARGFVLSGLRAGGITAYFNATGDLAACQWRGRWDSARTMEHYIQEAPMAAAYANLPAGVRADIVRLSAVLPALLEQAGPSPDAS